MLLSDVDGDNAQNINNKLDPTSCHDEEDERVENLDIEVSFLINPISIN